MILHYGKLKVLKEVKGKRKWGFRVWFCECDCGGKIELATCSLGRVRSCGCLLKVARIRNGKAKRIHGQAIDRTKEYTAWRAIIRRCAGARYKARGIKMCRRWRNSFVLFFKDMGKAPSEKHSIDRINNNGHYKPGNCRWATSQQQQINKSNNVWLTYKGQTKTVAEWSRTLGIRRGTIYKRIRDGFTDTTRILSKEDFRCV